MGDGTITLCTYNILEHGTVTLSVSADTGYPIARIYDRSGVLYWTYTTGATPVDRFGFEGDEFGFEGDEFGFGYEEQQDIIFTVDQGSAIKNVDLLYIAGHNFDGRNMAWECGNDGEYWTAAASWTQRGNGPIIKTLSSALAKRYWRVKVATHVNPMCSEIIISDGQAFQVLGNVRPLEQPKGNVGWSKSIGGLERSIKYGQAVKGWGYRLRFNGQADFDNFKAAMADLDDYSKPFLIKDLNDDYFLARRLYDPSYEHDPPLRTYEDFSIMEVL